MKKLEKTINYILEKKFSALSFLAVFCSIIFLRVFVEQFIAKSSVINDYEIVIEYIHNVYFFLIAFVILWIFLSWILKINPGKLTGIFVGASLLIIFPPLIDMIKTKGEVFWSFYVITSAKDLPIQFFTFFGHLPSGIVYFGTKVVFLIAIFLFGVVAYVISKKVATAIFAALGSYVVLFFMGSFPTIFSLLYYPLFSSKKIGEIQSFEVASFFGSPRRIFGLKEIGIKYTFPYNLEFIFFLFLIFLLSVLFFQLSRKKFWSFFQNFRFPQIAYHLGLFFVGMGLGLLDYPQSYSTDIFSFFSAAVLMLSIILAWLSSVVVNDIYDFEIDSISNQKRPLPSGIFNKEDYAQLGWILFFLSLLGGITIGIKFFILLLVYQIIAWMYSAEPLRLKKYPGIASFVSSLASLVVVFVGYILMSPDQTIYGFSWRVILLLVIAYTISIPIKDFKDIEGDGKYGIWTIPVLFGEKKARIIIGTNLFIAFVMSVFFLNELRLFWWALFFGSVAFLIVNSKKIKPQGLFWRILGAVTIYGLILVKIVFM
jgi:4-hydroxybenzoate polyprenyltransferase